jgi:hypothetical protein
MRPSSSMPSTTAQSAMAGTASRARLTSVMSGSRAASSTIAVCARNAARRAASEASTGQRPIVEAQQRLTATRLGVERLVRLRDAPTRGMCPARAAPHDQDEHRGREQDAGGEQSRRAE